MNTFQKIAALIYRLMSIGMIIYSGLTMISVAAIMKMPQMALLMLPILVAGVILYFAALPLAWLTTLGFRD